ncbi:hypothetical protein [Marinobacter halotolerans]|uniref:hypothetical protein n=1 Tax=Marinobacter halotolerans TaxID=1569211 RepID=UPI00124561A8|nr:hypothetical protein [Marinobacter halotolerans]
MEHLSELNTAEPEHMSFDAVEIAGLIVPLLFAIMTIVLVAMNPDPSGVADKESKEPEQRLEQIHQHR